MGDWSNVWAIIQPTTTGGILIYVRVNNDKWIDVKSGEVVTVETVSKYVFEYPGMLMPLDLLSSTKQLIKQTYHLNGLWISISPNLNSWCIESSNTGTIQLSEFGDIWTQRIMRTSFNHLHAFVQTLDNELEPTQLDLKDFSRWIEWWKSVIEKVNSVS